MNWKLLLIALVVLAASISARPAEENSTVIAELITKSEVNTSATKSKPLSTTTRLISTTPNVSSSSESSTESVSIISTSESSESSSSSASTSNEATTVNAEDSPTRRTNDRLSDANQENRELKVSSDDNLTIKASNSILVKETFHHGVAVPMTLEDYEKEMNHVKKQKVASSTPKEGISTWILLNNPTTKTEIKIPAYRTEDEKKTTKTSQYTTKKRITTTPKVTKAATKSTSKPSPKPSGKPTPKPTSKPNQNKLLTKVKVSVLNEAKNASITSTTTKSPVSITTRKVYKRTTTPATTTQKITTTTEQEEPEEDDDEPEEVEKIQKLSRTTVATPFLVLEAKDAEFNLPQDRSPTSPANRKTKIPATKSKKKKTTISRIKKKSDVKKPGDNKLGKKPEKPITTQIYQYLAREVMPSVGAGLVGLVVTAGLASYFLGGPLTALRRSYDISNRKDEGVFDRSDDFNGNAHAEEEMFGKVIAGMPENSVYRNNIRVHSYRPKPQKQYQQQPQQYSGYAQYAANNQAKYQNQQEVQQPQIRYRTIGYGEASNDNSYNRPQYRPQYVQQDTNAKSAPIEYSMQIDAQPEIVQQLPQVKQPKINVDTIELTTSQPEYNNNVDYDDQVKNYYQTEQEVQTYYKSEPEVHEQQQSSEEKPSAEEFKYVTPQNHKMEDENKDKPHAAALGSVTVEDEYQNSIANNILSKRKQFVVGSVLPEPIEEKISGVPEHGPRRKRNVVPKSKSLQNNEIDGENEFVLKNESADLTSSTTLKSEVTTIINAETVKDDNCTQTYEMTKGGSGLVDLLKRIVDLKVRLTVSFLQNATTAFQEYLRGVESRVNNFMPFVKTNNTQTEAEVNNVSEPIKTNVIYKKYW